MGHQTLYPSDFKGNVLIRFKSNPNLAADLSLDQAARISSNMPLGRVEVTKVPLNRFSRALHNFYTWHSKNPLRGLVLGALMVGSVGVAIESLILVGEHYITLPAIVNTSSIFTKGCRYLYELSGYQTQSNV